MEWVGQTAPGPGASVARMPQLESQVRTQVWNGAETHMSVICGMNAL